MLLRNLGLSLLKSLVPAAGGTYAGFSLAPILFPHCGSVGCAVAGALLGNVVTLTLWGGSAQSSFQKPAAGVAGEEGGH